MGRTITYPDGEKGYAFSRYPHRIDGSCDYTGLVITARKDRVVIISKRDKYAYQVAPVLEDGTLGKLQSVSSDTVNRAIKQKQAEPYEARRAWSPS